jgi:homogentisate 1,2-dioxygenase
VYRIRPSVQHVPTQFSPFTTRSGDFGSPPFDTVDFTPEAYRFKPRPLPSQPTDFIDGLFTVARNGGGPVSGDGAAGHVYAINKSMSNRVFRNQDGDMLFIPQEGTLSINTEFGDLEVAPMEIAIIPRGVTFRVNLLDDQPCRGYVLENFGAPFILPEMGPIGISSGLAHPRHFLAPTAKYHDDDSPGQLDLVAKLNGKLYHGPLAHNPFDVVAWYGSHVPVKFDLRLFMPINAVGFDHPDPSIGCVLQSPTAVPGVSNIDFVIFPPRWMVTENTFRPPWYHRNVMSELMGLIKGSYDAKSGDEFPPGALSIHNQFTPHGPDAQSLEKALSEDTVGHHTRYDNTMAFMWESNKVWVPTSEALTQMIDTEYVKCWKDIPKTFDPKNVPQEPHPMPFRTD